MDGLLSLIIFFVISIIFNNIAKSNKKVNKNKRPMNDSAENYEQYQKKYNQTEMKQVFEELKKNIKGLDDKVSDKVNRAKKKQEEMLHQRATLNKKSEQREQKKDISDNPRKMRQDFNRNNPLIPEDYESLEGISANTDYIERKDLTKGGALLANKTTSTYHISGMEDLKHALIMKEILDKPLSLRR